VTSTFYRWCRTSLPSASKITSSRYSSRCRGNAASTTYPARRVLRGSSTRHDRTKGSTSADRQGPARPLSRARPRHFLHSADPQRAPSLPAPRMPSYALADRKGRIRAAPTGGVKSPGVDSAPHPVTGSHTRDRALLRVAIRGTPSRPPGMPVAAGSAPNDSRHK
jgi:hypothetical protein